MPASAIENLFAAVAKNPDDLPSYQVLADALEQAGDPRAELVQVSHRLATAKPGKDRDKLAKRHAELIGERRAAILGPLAKQASIELAFEIGLLEAVTVKTPLPPADMAKALVAVYKSVDAQRLRRVIIAPGDPGRVSAADREMMGGDDDDGESDGDDDDDDDDDNDDETEATAADDASETVVANACKDLFAALAKAKAKPPASLRHVSIGTAFQRDRGFRIFSDPWSLHEDDVGGVLDAFPGITELRLDLGMLALKLAPLVSETLTRFEWMSPSASGELAKILAKSKLPALEAFSIGGGGQYLANEEYEVIGEGLEATSDQEECLSSDDLEPIFKMLDKCEKLVEFGLPNFAGDMPTLFPALAKHAFVKQLRVLDLSWCDIDTDAAKALAKVLKKATSLKELRLEGTVIDAAGKKAIQAPGVELVGKPATGNERYRYIVTME
jgi:uncharacterized protein (TIGR02996 family)